MALLRDELHYRYLGDRIDRAGNIASKSALYCPS